MMKSRKSKMNLLNSLKYSQYLGISVVSKKFQSLHWDSLLYYYSNDCGCGGYYYRIIRFFDVISHFTRFCPLLLYQNIHFSLKFEY